MQVLVVGGQTGHVLQRGTLQRLQVALQAADAFLEKPKVLRFHASNQHLSNIQSQTFVLINVFFKLRNISCIPFHLRGATGNEIFC